jgi:hypothetical protein
MSRETVKGSSFFGRRRNLLLAIAALLVVIIVVVVVVVVVTGDDSDDAGKAAGAGDTGGSATSFPYDMVELPDDVSLDVVSKAAFVSILVPNDKGTLTSYGVSSELPAAQAIIKAVSGADEVDKDLAASVTASTVALSSGSGSAGTPTITFVFASRETLTFALALDESLVARGGKAWRVDGDLKALVQAAIKAPQ